jgi:hypothetical protein
MTKFNSWLRHQYRRIKVKYLRWIKTNQIFKGPENNNGYEKISCAIVRKMINHLDSKFTIAPLSKKRYIVNKTLDIFIIIEDSKVEITNHVYHYVITLNQKDVEKITNLFDNKVEDQRVAYEEQIKSQITNTLHKIYDKINGEQTNN